MSDVKCVEDREDAKRFYSEALNHGFLKPILRDLPFFAVRCRFILRGNG
jgi:hypothetical protein